MYHLVLGLFLVASSNAQFWPLDFGDYSSNQPNDSVWLDPGRYPVDIDPTVDYSEAFIEFTFKSVYPSHNCEYQVWADDHKVFSGSFRNAVATMIPSMRGSFPLGTSEISVWTSGCYFHRIAIPYTLGQNGESLYVYDITPETSYANLILTNPLFSFGISAPDSFENFEAFESTFNGVGNAAKGQSGTGSFSSQVGALQNDKKGFFYGGSPSQTFLIPLYWADINGFNSTDSQFVVELPYYTKQSTVGLIGVGCNSSRVACNNIDAVFSDEANPQIKGIETNVIYSDMEFDTMIRASSIRQPEATTLKTGAFHFQWDSTRIGSQFGPLLLLQSQDSSNINAIWSPYAKLWNLDPAANSDPNHVVIDLRGLTTPVSSAGSCTLISSFVPNITYFSEASGPNSLTGSVYDFGSDGSQAVGFYSCPNDASGQLSNPVAASCSHLSDVATFNSQVVTNPVTVTINLAGGALMSLPIYDFGLPFLLGGPCTSPATYDDVYLSQLSWFDVFYDSQYSGTVGQALLTNNFQGRASAHGISETFFIDTTVTNGADLVFRSKPGFSASFYPFVFIHGLRESTGNASGCDESLCKNGGVCASISAQVCTNPDSQGGAASLNEGSVSNVQGVWSGLWYGAENDQPVPYCTLDTCWNGGVCVENLGRTWNAELYGTGGADNTTWCNCSEVTRETVLNISDGSSTGSYWGSKCQYPPPCDANPCLNGGICTNGVGPAFTCDCSSTAAPYSKKPYTGDRCEIDETQPCDLNPCLNSGSCSNTAGTAGGYTCDCTSSGGWSGHSCQIPPVDNCVLVAATDVCGQFGRCVASVNKAGIATGADYTQCLCFYGYSGPTCTTPPAACSADYTESWQKRDLQNRQFNQDYCLNGGSCIGVGDANGDSKIVACLCVDPWVGSRCQWNSTLFTASS